MSGMQLSDSSNLPDITLIYLVLKLLAWLLKLSFTHSVGSAQSCDKEIDLLNWLMLR